MAKLEVKVLTLRHPMSLQGYEQAADLAEMYASKGFILHAERSEGSVQRIELRKSLDYSRAERRAAKHSGQVLDFNSFKGILPDGMVPIMPDDPRLQVSAQTEGDA